MAHKMHLRSVGWQAPFLLSLSEQFRLMLDRPALIQSFRPHMQMRGTAMTMEAIHPDGLREVLSSVDQCNHWWQIAYIYEEDAQPLLPKGTVLLFHSQYDNTMGNPINPDPDQWVVFGARGADEIVPRLARIPSAGPGTLFLKKKRSGYPFRLALAILSD